MSNWKSKIHQAWENQACCFYSFLCIPGTTGTVVYQSRWLDSLIFGTADPSFLLPILLHECGVRWLSSLPPLSTLILLRRHNDSLDDEVTAKHLRGIFRGWKSELKTESSELSLQEPNLERWLRAEFQWLHCPLAPVWPCADFTACDLVERGKSILCLASRSLSSVACLLRREFWLQLSFRISLDNLN